MKVVLELLNGLSTHPRSMRYHPSAAGHHAAAAQADGGAGDRLEASAASVTTPYREMHVAAVAEEIAAVRGAADTDRRGRRGSAPSIAA